MSSLILRGPSQLVLAALLIGSHLFTSALAGGGVTNVDDDGVAIKGHDPVAYFNAGTAVKGSAEHAVEWDGATWHFANAENRATFQSNPGKYAPQYGGYCAVGTRMGLKIDVQPDLFKVVDGKLYLNSSDKAHALWLKDVPGSIATADSNWPEIKDKSPAELKATRGN